MGNIVVTPFAPSSGDSDSPVLIKWNKEGKFGPFNIPTQASYRFGSPQDFQAQGAITTNWNQSQFVIMHIEGSLITNSASSSTVRFGTGTGSVIFSGFEANKTYNVSKAFVIGAVSANATTGINYYYPLTTNVASDTLPGDPTILYFINIGSSNLYITVYTGNIVLK